MALLSSTDFFNKLKRVTSRLPFVSCSHLPENVIFNIKDVEIIRNENGHKWISLTLDQCKTNLPERFVNFLTSDILALRYFRRTIRLFVFEGLRPTKSAFKMSVVSFPRPRYANGCICDDNCDECVCVNVSIVDCPCWSTKYKFYDLETSKKFLRTAYAMVQEDSLEHDDSGVFENALNNSLNSVEAD